MVGVDGSPTSDAAIGTAFEEASWRRAELVAVHAWLEYTSDHVLSQGLDEGWEQAEQAERELLAQRLAGWQEKYPDVDVRRVVQQGRPVERLLEYAVGAQLVVVGSRERRVRRDAAGLHQSSSSATPPARCWSSGRSRADLPVVPDVDARRGGDSPAGSRCDEQPGDHGTARPCGCREPFHVMRRARIRGSDRRAGLVGAAW